MQKNTQKRFYFQPLPIGAVKLDGKIGRLTGNVIFHRINSPEARNVVYRETIDAFRNKIDDANGVTGIWQGEYWGKWMISAVRAAEYTGDAELKSFLRSAAYELISLRDENGCISTYRNPDWFNAAAPEEVKKVLGVVSDWNWNIWCRKYTLWGLLEAYRLLGEKPILDAASDLAANLIDTLEKKNTDLRKTGTFCGLASCSILKPMLQLYRYSGDERFGNFARDIVDSWRNDDGIAPGLISNAFSGKPLHLWHPECGFWTKAYEMMSCVDGILLYSTLFDDQSVVDAAENLYELILKYEYNRCGNVGFNDQFQHSALYLDSISEPCDAIHWMRMCFELFKLTGKVRYMETFEHTFLNAFLAGITRDGKWGMRAVRSSGHHMTAPEQAKMNYNHCCVNNLPRGLFNAAESCFMTGENCAAVNMYIPFSADGVLPDGNQVQLTLSGDVLTGDKAVISVSASRELTLKLRVPQWSTENRFTVNGKDITADSEYATVVLPAGNSRIEVEFKLAVYLETFPADGEVAGLPQWHLRRYMEGKNSEGLPLHDSPKALLHAGALLMARSKLIGDSAENMFHSPSMANGKFSCSLKKSDDPDTLAQFTAEFTAPDGSVRVEKVCDYASAGNIDSTDTELFTMFF